MYWQCQWRYLVVVGEAESPDGALQAQYGQAQLSRTMGHIRVNQLTVVVQPAGVKQIVTHQELTQAQVGCIPPVTQAEDTAKHVHAKHDFEMIFMTFFFLICFKLKISFRL